jgi:hypothetical protein
MVQDFNCGQMRESGFIFHYEFVLVAGTKARPYDLARLMSFRRAYGRAGKNRDKQLTFIVRVSFRVIFQSRGYSLWFNY